MNKLRQWHNDHENEITWFLIGSFIAFGFNDFGKGDFLWATVDFALAYVNYIFRKSK